MFWGLFMAMDLPVNPPAVKKSPEKPDDIFAREGCLSKLVRETMRERERERERGGISNWPIASLVLWFSCVI